MSKAATALIGRLIEDGTIESNLQDGLITEAPAAVNMIWKKLPPSTRSKVTIEQLREFLTAILDDGDSVQQAGRMIKIPRAAAAALWIDVEKTGMV